MAKAGYSYKVNKEEGVAKAVGGELRISPKHSVEICRAIKGKKLEKAKEYLRRVIEENEAIPFRRYKKGVAHRKGITKAYAGRYPVKAASQILEVLEDAESNAEYKGLNVEKLFIKHIAARRGRVIKGIIPRAMGRASAFNTPTTNIEVILEEGR